MTALAVPRPQARVTPPNSCRTCGHDHTETPQVNSTNHHPHVKASCPVCGVDLAFSLRQEEDGAWSIQLTLHGEIHIEEHYK